MPVSANLASAFGKISAGGVTRPAPTWPTPATLPAIPVLICGRMPVRHTFVTSMPVGVPWNSSTGTAQRGFSPSVISCIRRVVASASGTEPPTNRTIAGAVAIANPPMPDVSVIAESPMSGFASSGP